MGLGASDFHLFLIATAPLLISAHISLLTIPVALLTAKHIKVLDIMLSAADILLPLRNFPST